MKPTALKKFYFIVFAIVFSTVLVVSCSSDDDGTPPAPVDSDNDTIVDGTDNCPNTFNPDQLDE